MLPLLSANTFFLRIYIYSTVTPKLFDCTFIQPSIVAQVNVASLPFVALHLSNHHYSSTRPSNTSFSHNETEAHTATKYAGQPTLLTTSPHTRRVRNRKKQHCSQFFNNCDLGMTLKLTFKIKTTRPHRDLSNKKKIIDLSHTITELHALEVYTLYRPYVIAHQNFEGS